MKKVEILWFGLGGEALGSMWSLGGGNWFLRNALLPIEFFISVPKTVFVQECSVRSDDKVTFFLQRIGVRDCEGCP